jgi:hypothetical protein
MIGLLQFIKRDADEAGAGNVAAGDLPGANMASEEDWARWDEDDVMLFFWGNSQVTAERYRTKQMEDSHLMEQSRLGVPSVSI